MDSKKQVNLIRTFDAPISAVWKAWTTPDAWVEWYGKPWEVPKDSAEMDVRVGGKWHSTTIAQGMTINFTGDYLEVNEPDKLVLTVKNPDDPSDPNFETVTATFKDVGNGKTEMDFTQKGNLPPEEYEKGLREGWTGFFNALESYLSKS